MRVNLSAISIGLLALCAGTAATAQEGTSMFSFSGFGTIGYVTTNTNDATYTTGSQKYGATTSGDFGPDTKVGVQVNAKFNNTFSGTVQAFSKQDILGSYEPALEWAFLKANLGSGFSARVGRMGGPFFMTSDFRNVGYTNVSMRTPPDVYSAVPVRSFDGADLLYQGSFGDVTINGQFYAGKASVVVGQDIKLFLNDLAGFSATAEIGSVTFRAGHTQTTFDSEGAGLAGFSQILGGLKQFGALPGLGSLGTLGENIVINGKKATFTGIGATLELGPWVGSAEVTKRKTESLYVSDVSSWYTTAGYRIDKFTPYISLSGRTTDTVTSVSAPSTAGYPPIVQGTVPVLIANVNGGILSNNNQKTFALGTRWEAGKSYAVKGEWAQISVPAGSSGGFSNVKGGRFASDTNVNVISVGLDFVF